MLDCFSIHCNKRRMFNRPQNQTKCRLLQLIKLIRRSLFKLGVYELLTVRIERNQSANLLPLYSVNILASAPKNLRFDLETNVLGILSNTSR